MSAGMSIHTSLQMGCKHVSAGRVLLANGANDESWGDYDGLTQAQCSLMWAAANGTCALHGHTCARTHTSRHAPTCAHSFSLASRIDAPTPSTRTRTHVCNLQKHATYYELTQAQAMPRLSLLCSPLVSMCRSVQGLSVSVGQCVRGASMHPCILASACLPA